MSVREEVEVALKELLLPELGEIKKVQIELSTRLNEVNKIIRRIGQHFPRTDFDTVDDLQVAGATKEQAHALVRARYEISQASKAHLGETGLKVEGDLTTAGFTPELAETIVGYMKDRLAS